MFLTVLVDLNLVLMVLSSIRTCVKILADFQFGGLNAYGQT